MIETFKTIDVIIATIKKHRRNNDYINLVIDGLALLEYTKDLINYSIVNESNYRKLEAEILDKRDETGRRNTSSFAETQAKASDYYKEWQRTKQFIELIYELTNMCKKLASNIDNQIKAS